MCCVLLLSGRSLLVNSSMTRPMTLVVTSGLWASQPLSWEMETLPSLKCILWKCSLRSQGRTPDGALDSSVPHEPGRREASWYAISFLIWESLIVRYVSFSKRRERATDLWGHKEGMFLQDHTLRNGASLEQLSTSSATNFPRCSFCALHKRNTDAV